MLGFTTVDGWWAPGRDLRRTVETALKDLGVSREDRAELLSHGRSGVQAAHYERSDMLPAKLRALQTLEGWVLGEPPAATTKQPHLRAVARCCARV